MAEVPQHSISSSRPSVLILYGSETGNSQDIAEELGRMAQRLHFETSVEELDAVQVVGPTSSQRPRGRLINLPF
jgi:sulfite reductase alpha subunit-like flavoprotein